MVTNSTYDGLCYNAEKIADEIGSAVDFLHFDEARYAYAAFHPFYENHYGMAKGKPRGQTRSSSPPIPPTSCWPRSRRPR